ncbi:MAG: S8 family serine peptidase [Actinomycetota bacterium]
MSLPFAPRHCLVAVPAALLFVAASLPGPVEAAPQMAPIDDTVAGSAGRTSALVHLDEEIDLPVGLAAARAAGLETGTTYDAIDVFVAYGSASEFEDVAAAPGIQYVEANAPIRLFTETSHRATRGQNVLNGEVTLTDGSVIDGSGVGVAVVDSGVDGTHPDLMSRMGRNVKLICPAGMPGATAATPFAECRTRKVAVPFADTDTPSAGGHGTHVAGIVAGTGQASGGRFHGAAPGATLYGVSSGTFLTVENALDGLAWVLENHDEVTPAIRVVNNSWGSVYQDYDPDNGVFHQATWKLQEALVDAGVTVVFAAGNSFGSGFRPTTTAECINPTPGIICVANYRDENDGRRDGSIDGSSSRGEWDRPETWPDVAAPGTDIVSTCRVTLPVCTMLGVPVDDNYASLTGTSMAAPNVAGIVAQVLQADPSLTPAEVENLLEDTAHKFAWNSSYGLFVDDGNPDNSSAYEKGHGLVDALAAVRVALGLDPAPDPSEFPAPPDLPVYEEDGLIFGAPTFIGESVTQREFQNACLFPPVNQSLDAHVFEIPAEFRDTLLFARTGGSDPIGFHVLAMSFYDADCGAPLVNRGPTAADVPEDARYVVVTAPFAFEAQIVLELFERRTIVPTVLRTSVTGAGVNKVITATLVTVDGSEPVAGATIAFFADGDPIGEAVTDTTGTATRAVPPHARGAQTIYCATFAGDDTYSAAGDC